ncbi:MAG: hypothetical protein JW748_13375 [Anaerolineales bacterium]|nr:hypothetical protein [Anaerolineales bacterium]
MRRVFLDPDGTNKEFFGVIIQHASGVRYSQQCGCTATALRETEGYYVPLKSQKTIIRNEATFITELRNVFHNKNNNADYGFSEDQMMRLAAIIESIPWWNESERLSHLRLDEKRKHEITEAWVPIFTPDGPGILIWPNCD